MRETEETELKLKHEVNTQNGTFKKSREIEDEIQSDIEPFYEQLDVLHNGKSEDKKIKNKNQPREEPDAATQPYDAEMEAQYSQIPQKSSDPIFQVTGCTQTIWPVDETNTQVPSI